MRRFAINRLHSLDEFAIYTNIQWVYLSVFESTVSSNSSNLLIYKLFNLKVVVFIPDG